MVGFVLEKFPKKKLQQKNSMGGRSAPPPPQGYKSENITFLAEMVGYQAAIDLASQNYAGLQYINNRQTMCMWYANLLCSYFIRFI